MQKLRRAETESAIKAILSNDLGLNFSCFINADEIQKKLNINNKLENFLNITEKVKYIFPFENRGEVVGVTMPHPHGQIYGHPFVPLKLKIELDNCKEHYAKYGTDMLGDMNKEELKFGKRIIAEKTYTLGNCSASNS